MAKKFLDDRCGSVFLDTAENEPYILAVVHAVDSYGCGPPDFYYQAIRLSDGRRWKGRERADGAVDGLNYAAPSVEQFYWEKFAKQDCYRPQEVAP